MNIGKILIIDDEKVNAESLKDMLEDVKYQVSLAFDAQMAKDLVAKKSFDLIMMDVWMPGQDGILLLEEWQQADFFTPIVMMSGHAQHQDVVKAMRLGAIDFLQKPLHDVLPLVRKILSEQREDGQARLNLTDNADLNTSFKEARQAFEMRYFNYHLTQYNHNITKVAEISGMERTTLYRRLKDLGIDKK
jgi:DNA-binding NtrC family response regulator